jgi:hypothetical protein
MMIRCLRVEPYSDDERNGGSKSVENELLSDRLAVHAPSLQPLEPFPHLL